MKEEVWGVSEGGKEGGASSSREEGEGGGINLWVGLAKHLG